MLEGPWRELPVIAIVSGCCGTPMTMLAKDQNKNIRGSIEEPFARCGAAQAWYAIETAYLALEFVVICQLLVCDMLG